MKAKHAISGPRTRVQRLKRHKTGSTDAGGTEISPEWPWHHRTLLSLRNRLTNARDEQAMEASQPLDADPGAPAETGTDASDHDLCLALLGHEEDLLREIDAALTRIATGKYGICEESGERIPLARLRAVPWTRHTKEVAERLEHEGREDKPGGGDNERAPER